MYDFRSDTFTRPTEAMRQAMFEAEVGDDVFGEDPTVNGLQDHVAELLGKEAGLFVSSGTQSNLVALMAHCERGDEYLVGQRAHCFRWEAGGAAVLGSIQPQPIEMHDDGTMDLAAIEANIKIQPSGHHFARSKLLAIENTNDGKPLPHDYVHRAQTLARSHGLGTHLDGARLWNAAIADGVAPAVIADGFDTVSVCLSKGLGAPVGSVLVGSAELVDRARRWRKMVGGGMRQAGVIAAGGRHAIDHHIDRLADDHARAARLAAGLSELPGLTVDGPHTNMVFVTVEDVDQTTAGERLAGHGITVIPGSTMRLVCHLDIDDEGIERAIAGFGHLVSAG